MHGDGHKIDRIARLAYEAAIDTSRWEEMLAEIGAWFGASGAALITPDSGPADARRLFAGYGSAADCVDEYAAVWVGDDAWMCSPAFAAARAAGAAVRGDEIIPTAQLRRTAFYGEFLRHHDIELILGLSICGPDDARAPATRLAVFRAPGADGFDAGDVERVRVLWPHLRRAVQAHWSLLGAREHQPTVERTLDALRQPAWVLHADLKVAYANVAARDLARRARWVREHHDRLHAVADLDADALRSAVREASLGGGRDCTAAHAECGRVCRALLRVAPLPAGTPYALAWPQARALLTLDETPQAAAGAWLDRSAQRYRLTPSERRLLDRLVAGLSLREIAGEQQVALNTVRTHLRALFAKTDCHRQADLLRLALGA